MGFFLDNKAEVEAMWIGLHETCRLNILRLLVEGDSSCALDELRVNGRLEGVLDNGKRGGASD